MAGMAGRMSTVIKAKISKLLDRAEDPGETLDYSYEKQMELLQNVKKGVADVVTSKKRLQMQSQKLEQQVVKLDTQARQALAAGNEELARAALERKTLAQSELQGLDPQIKELEAQQDQLTENEKKLRTIRVPIFLGHGTRDSIIPFAMSKKLATAAGGPVTKYDVVDGDHNDVFDVGGTELRDAITSFIEAHARG